jgi:hypothetical protein
VRSVFGATDEAYGQILGFISINGQSVQCELVWTQDPFHCRASFWVINGQLLVRRHVRTHLSGFQVVWMSGNWIGRGLHSSVGDFPGVGRGYQAQDACYWLVSTILLGHSMWCLLHSRIVRGVQTWGKRNLRPVGIAWLAQWLDGSLVRFGALASNHKLHAFDGNPDLVTSIPNLDERVPRTFLS